MYSVIVSGGLQHKITLGETLKLPKIEAGIGDELSVSEVLLYSDEGKVHVGTPIVADAVIKLEVLSQGREDKIIVFKRKARKRYRLTRGHRQPFTEVLVTEMGLGATKHAVEDTIKVRARARIVALEAQKAQITKPTRAQKVAAAQKVEA